GVVTGDRYVVAVQSDPPFDFVSGVEDQSHTAFRIRVEPHLRIEAPPPSFIPELVAFAHCQLVAEIRGGFGAGESCAEWFRHPDIEGGLDLRSRSFGDLLNLGDYAVRRGSPVFSEDPVRFGSKR